MYIISIVTIAVDIKFNSRSILAVVPIDIMNCFIFEKHYISLLACCCMSDLGP